VGSQLTLVSFLKRMGKNAVPLWPGPFKRTEIKPYEALFSVKLPGEGFEKNRLIIADCASPDRTGDLEHLLGNLPTAVIDHHIGGRYARGGESCGPVYLDGKAPSTTFMVFQIIKAMGFLPTREEADLLFFGLCTDTGFFGNVDETGARTFEAAAELVRLGANPKKIYERIYGGKSLGSRIIIGRTLARSESHFGGGLILSTEELEETRDYGMEGRDSDSVYQMLQTISGMEAVVVIRQDTPEKVAVGFRSRDQVDVAAVARLFGGGGHKNAAGANIEGTIAEVKPKILAAFENSLSGNPIR
jgi:phosphoesterase RecJ-like protein